MLNLPTGLCVRKLYERDGEIQLLARVILFLGACIRVFGGDVFGGDVFGGDEAVGGASPGRVEILALRNTGPFESAGQIWSK